MVEVHIINDLAGSGVHQNIPQLHVQVQKPMWSIEAANGGMSEYVGLSFEPRRRVDIGGVRQELKLIGVSPRQLESELDIREIGPAPPGPGGNINNHAT